MRLRQIHELFFWYHFLRLYPWLRSWALQQKGSLARLGSVVGGLLNSTLSNAPELIIGIVALRNGLGRVVKASLTGSIMVNLLVGLGCALVVGGLKYGVHSFDRRQLRSSGLMLVMCGFCFIVPAVFRIGTPQGTRDLSFELSFILLAIYIGNVSVNILDGRLTAHDATIKSTNVKESYSVGRSLAVLGLQWNSFGRL